ncbi:hypothetical protein N7488_008831 [Penicillium malachiteum]|nr:hypothetical protein N7488_008831 [Penicillium malachiteum]
MLPLKSKNMHKEPDKLSNIEFQHLKKPLILRLPNELLLYIAGFLLENRDLVSLLQADRRWKNLLEDYVFRKNLSKSEESALPLCARNGAISSIHKILKLGAKGDEVDTNNRTAWSYAAQNGDITIKQMLLDHDAHLGEEQSLINKAGDDNRTPLSWAAEGGQLELVQNLIKNDADVNITRVKSPVL